MLVEHATDEQLRLVPRGEERPAVVVALHVAGAHLRINARVMAIAEGRPVPHRQPHLFDSNNAAQHAANPRPRRQEVVEKLRGNGALIADRIRMLNDSQLLREGVEDEGDGPVTARFVIEERQIGHISRHMAAIREVLAQP